MSCVCIIKIRLMITEDESINWILPIILILFVFLDPEIILSLLG
jgi:hypothetical protein